MMSHPSLVAGSEPTRSRRLSSLAASTSFFLVTTIAAALSLGCTTRNAAGVEERSLDRGREILGRYRSEDFLFYGRSLAVALRDGHLGPADDWTLVNATNPDTRRELESKRGDAWVRELNFDVRGSGVEEERVYLARYDLLFRHRTTGASLSVRTHPMSSWARAISLRSLADDRIDADSAEMAYAIAQGSSAAVAVDTTERVAVLFGGAPVSVDHETAYAFEYRIHDANRFELELPESPYRVRTVFVRPSWNWSLANRGWPVILEITLSARDVDFESVATALDDLVARIRLAPEGVAEGVPAQSKEAIRQCFLRERIEPRYVGIVRNYRRNPVSYVVDDHDEVRLAEDAPLRRCLSAVLSRLPMTTASYFLGVQFAGRSEPEGLPPFSPAIWSHLDRATATPGTAGRTSGSEETPAEPVSTP